MILTTAATNTLRAQPPSVLAGLAILTLLPLYIASYQFRLHYPALSSTTAASTISSGLALPSFSDTFIDTWLSHDLLSPFNPHPLRFYCNDSARATNASPKRNKRKNVVLNLANANGGIGNIRGNLLDFLFFALETSSSILLPGFSGRDEANIANVWGSWKGFGEFFDQDFFLEIFGKVCSDLEVFVLEEGMELKEAINGGRGNFRPGSRRGDLGVGTEREGVVKGLERYLEEVDDGKGEEGEMQVLNLERTLWDVDTRALPLGFRRNFGGLLRIRRDIRRLAAVVVQSLAEKFGLSIDPRDGVPRGAFYGAHLRTEADAGAAGWLNDGEVNANFSAQTDAYIAHAVKKKLGVMYVATGNSSDLELFKRKAANHRPSITVVSKHDLLPQSELATFEKLSWDQKALIDYEVLKRCSVFGGFVKSSFSYNVAMARNQWLEDQGWVVDDPWSVQHSEVGVSFDDGLSRIVGRDAWHEGRIPRGMWP